MGPRTDWVTGVVPPHPQWSWTDVSVLVLSRRRSDEGETGPEESPFFV